MFVLLLVLFASFKLQLQELWLQKRTTLLHLYTEGADRRRPGKDFGWVRSGIKFHLNCSCGKFKINIRLFLKHSSIRKSEYLCHVNLAYGLAYQLVLFNLCNPEEVETLENKSRVVF